MPRPASRIELPRCSPVRAPHYFRRAGKGQLQKAPEETVKAALLGIERKSASRRRSRPGPRSWWPASARSRSKTSSTRSSSSPDKNAPNTRPWSKPVASRSARRWTCCKGSAPSTSPYQFHWKRFLFEQFPQGGRASRRWKRRHQARRDCRWPTCAVLDRRLADHRDRRRAVGAGPGHGHRHGLASTSPHRAWRSSLTRRPGQGRARTLLHRLHAGLEAHHAARRGGAGHAARGPRLPGVSHLRHARRGQLRAEGHETRLERVPIVANLRHDQLDGVITDATLAARPPPSTRFAPELAFALSPGERHSRPAARWCAASPRPSTGPTTTSAWSNQRGAERRRPATRPSKSARARAAPAST